MATPPEPSRSTIGALARQRVLDEDLVGSDERVGAADADVATAVDDEARVAAQARGDQVGGEALAGAAGVEADAGRAGDRRPPRRRPRSRASGPPGWGRRGGAAAPRPARRPAARPARRRARRRSRPTRSRATRVGSTSPSLRSAAASPAFTAVRSSSEAGTRSRRSALSAQSSLSGLKRESAASNSTMNRRACSAAVGGRGHPGPRLADQQPDVAAHRVEGDVVFAHDQDALVVTGAAPGGFDGSRAGEDRAAGDGGARLGSGRSW